METPFKFNTLRIATNFVARATKIMMIMLGSDELFWVVTPSQAVQLAKGGYEYAPLCHDEVADGWTELANSQN